MIEVRGNLWTFPADVRVITTNGFVKKNGQAVMGRGCALEAAQRWPDLPARLGKRITAFGNNLHLFGVGTDDSLLDLITFPVKHNWWEPADTELIKLSVKELREVALSWSARTIVMPRPGCGNGQLRWEDVGPLLASLPDNVNVITF